MLRANQAVRLGLRAATRNPELAFGKALLDLASAVLSLLPTLVALAGLLFVLGQADSLFELLRGLAALRRLPLPIAGMALTAAIVSWALSVAFRAGALPILAADAELSRRPPAGAFAAMAGRGFLRVLAASALGALLTFAFTAGVAAALFAFALVFARRPGIAPLAALSALLAFTIVGAVLLDLLVRLSIVRAAALGDGATRAFGRAARLLAGRLGTCLGVVFAFALLELVVAGAGAAFSGSLAGFGTPADLALSIAPRIAVALASGVVLAWLGIGRDGALAALAAEEEGLVPEPPAPPRRRIPEPWELRPPPHPGSGPPAIVEALPVEEGVIEAVPAEEDPPGGASSGKS